MKWFYLVTSHLYLLMYLVAILSFCVVPDIWGGIIIVLLWYLTAGVFKLLEEFATTFDEDENVDK